MAVSRRKGMCVIAVAMLAGLNLSLVAQDVGSDAARRSSDWPAFGGPAGNGTSPETGLAKAWPEQGPPVLWKRRIMRV